MNLDNHCNLNELISLEEKLSKQEKIERKNDLKEFMKKKKKEKSKVSEENGIIWMKGMEDILNLNIDKTSNTDIETDYSNYTSNKNSSIKQKLSSNNNLIEIENKPNSVKNLKFKNNDKNNNNNKEYYEELKDKEDYLNVHKMYIDLDHIQKEEDEEEEIPEVEEMIKENIYIDDINTLTRDFSLLSVSLSTEILS